jgi:hypothetical protein
MWAGGQEEEVAMPSPELPKEAMRSRATIIKKEDKEKPGLVRVTIYLS